MAWRATTATIALAGVPPLWQSVHRYQFKKQTTKKKNCFASELSCFNVETRRHIHRVLYKAVAFQSSFMLQRKTTAYNRRQPNCIQIGFRWHSREIHKICFVVYVIILLKISMSKTALIVCNFMFFKHLLFTADSCISREESVGCTEVISLTNIKGLLHGLHSTIPAQKHAAVGVWDSPRPDNRDKCHPFENRRGGAGGKSGAYL